MPGLTGVLDKLTAEQQAQLILWMDTEEDKVVLRKVCAPAPDGFGIRTHITSLRRFYARHQLEDRIADLELARAHAAAKTGSEELFLNAAENILTEKAFQFLTSPEFGPNHFRVVSNWLLKIRERQIRREQIQTTRERLALQLKRDKFLAAVREAQSRTAYQEKKICEARREFETDSHAIRSATASSEENGISDCSNAASRS